MYDSRKGFGWSSPGALAGTQDTLGSTPHPTFLSFLTWICWLIGLCGYVGVWVCGWLGQLGQRASCRGQFIFSHLVGSEN